MRVSTTAIESFRLWEQPDQAWMTEAELVATIRGAFVPTPAVLVGQAFGRILERPERYAVPGGYTVYVRDGRGGSVAYDFGADTMAPALALVDRRGVFEAKGSRTYRTPQGDVEVIAKGDQLLGADLLEFKTTSGTFDAEKYEASCQWRFMLDIFGALRCTYHVFKVDDHGNGVVEVVGIDTLPLYPYPALHADCAALVARFARYVEARGLVGVLRARQAAA